MIRIEHVEKSYGKRPVLKDVSLEVPTGRGILRHLRRGIFCRSGGIRHRRRLCRGGGRHFPDKVCEEGDTDSPGGRFFLCQDRVKDSLLRDSEGNAFLSDEIRRQLSGLFPGFEKRVIIRAALDDSPLRQLEPV